MPIEKYQTLEELDDSAVDSALWMVTGQHTQMKLIVEDLHRITRKHILLVITGEAVSKKLLLQLRQTGRRVQFQTYNGPVTITAVLATRSGDTDLPNGISFENLPLVFSDLLEKSLHDSKSILTRESPEFCSSIAANFGRRVSVFVKPIHEGGRIMKRRAIPAGRIAELHKQGLTPDAIAKTVGRMRQDILIRLSECRQDGRLPPRD